MSELAHAAKMLKGGLPKNCLIKNPAGTWSFVGSVDVRLMLEGTDEEIQKARQFGPGFAKVKVMTWPTMEAAVEYAKSLGLEVSLPVTK